MKTTEALAFTRLKEVDFDYSKIRDSITKRKVDELLSTYKAREESISSVVDAGYAHSKVSEIVKTDLFKKQIKEEADLEYINKVTDHAMSLSNTYKQIQQQMINNLNIDL
jgi:hypothetical protein